MIFVDWLPLSTNSQSDSFSQGSNSVTLTALMQHPTLLSASLSLKTMQETNFNFQASSPAWVYVFQREFATVHPSCVRFVGTDEATTCVGLVIRDRKSGMTSVAHMDSPKIVDNGLTQMLSGIGDHNPDADFDVHVVGGYEDVSPEGPNSTTGSKAHSKSDGYSFPLCSKLIETLGKRREKFHIQTLFILGHNTKKDSQGNACPIFNGFLVETSTGVLKPASFERTTRCPDEIVRRIRVTACCEDPEWNDRLLETYDTLTDRFVIAPCSWTWQFGIALMLQNLSDAEILLQCSSSPSAEGPDFVENVRRQCDYLMKYPKWQDTFPMRQPRIFERIPDGTWKRIYYH